MIKVKYCCKPKKVCYNASYWRRSSVVEQRNHNPLVRGPNPFAATKNSTPIYSRFNFWYRDLETGSGVRPAAKRRNNAGLPSGKFCKGVKRSETTPSRVVVKR